MPSLFAKAPQRRTPGHALKDFEIALDRLIGEARAQHVDPRTLSRHLEGRANALQLQWAVTAPAV